jgi:hypothetical protein
MATEKGYNELFSVARKVIILLISFKSPPSCENRAVLLSQAFQIVKVQNTLADTLFLPPIPRR